MSDPDPELLRSLGRLVRGLSSLFWGLPLSLLVCVQAAKMDWHWPLAVSAPLVTTGLLIFGLLEIGSFHKSERPWRAAVDRAKFFGLINCGLSPFLYWWNQMPDNLFFTLTLAVMAVSGVLFLFGLNLVVLRLGDMLPDEALRQETRQFTALNRSLLAFLLLAAALYVGLTQVPKIPSSFEKIFFITMRTGPWFLLFLGLPPLAMTMALVWKTKEVVMEGVFGAK